MKRILVTNDDGVHAPGLRAMREALGGLGEVVVVAPLSEQSATSHSLTLHHPLRIKEIEPGVRAVDGTPTDCVLLAVRGILEEAPHLVVSGINQGPNLGEDVLYSGTVAAAMEGAILGIPSMAVSLASWKHHDFDAATAVTRSLAEALLARSLPDRFLVSVNVPPIPIEEIQGLRVTRLGSRVYNDAIIRKTDPRGRDYFWIGGSEPTWHASSPESDFAAIEDRCVSLTPLLLDLTDQDQLDFLRGLELDLP